MTHHTRHSKKLRSPNLDLADIGDVIVIGHGSYRVLDTYDTHNGGAVWLEVCRLPSEFDPRGGLPFRMMVPKRRR